MVCRSKTDAIIDTLGKIYYCPLKRNRLVDDTGGLEKYQPIEQLNWSPIELKQGKLIKIKAFPSNKKVRLFRVIVSANSLAEFIVTNDIAQNSTDAVQQVCGVQSEN